MGKTTKPCVHCGKPTSLYFKLQSLDLTGKKVTVQKIPTHKSCVRPALASRKRLWERIGRRSP